MGYTRAADALRAAGVDHPALHAGIPDGVTLKPSGQGGILWLSRPGTYEGIDHVGQVVAKVPGVTLRNSRIRAQVKPDGARLVKAASGASIAIDSCELDGGGVAEIAVDGRFEIVNSVVHSCADGLRLTSGSKAVGCHVHSLTRIGTLHGDAAQSIGSTGWSLIGNILDSVSADGSDLNNAAIMLGSEKMQSANAVIHANVLCGGNFTLNVSGDPAGDTITVSDNTFVPGSRYGQVLAPRDIVVDGSNRMLTSAAPLKRSYT